MKPRLKVLLNEANSANVRALAKTYPSTPPKLVNEGVAQFITRHRAEMKAGPKLTKGMR